MNTLELITRLQAAVKKNPEAAWLPVMLAQYDSESASITGMEAAERVDAERYHVLIA